MFDLSWAEFQLRLFAYERETNNRRRDLRMIGWAALHSFHSDPKKIPKKISDYWAIEGDEQTPVLSDELRTAFINAVINPNK